MKKTVAVLFGGRSMEHEVSLKSAYNVLCAIDSARYNVRPIGITKKGKWYFYSGDIDLIPTGAWFDHKQALSEVALSPNARDLQDIDVFFPVLHGLNGEDGTIQGYFELLNKPYVGCGVLGSAAAMDKIVAKTLFLHEQIPTCAYVPLRKAEIESDMQGCIQKVRQAFPYPVFVKPANNGSSVGIAKAKDKESLAKALLEAARYDRRILVEEFINAREIEVAMLGNADDVVASVPGEIVADREFYDYDAKYSSSSTSQTLVPAALTPQTTQQIQAYAVKAFRALNLSGLSRIDFFVEKTTEQIYLNEVNTLPGFTDISMYAKLWAHEGLSYAALVDRLIALAFEEKQSKNELML